MADFKTAYAVLLPLEGGYANVKNDRGGETYAGISRVFFPKWEGWKIIDKNKPLKHNAFIKDPKLDALKAAFYKTNFWDKISGDHIQSQRIAGFLFDWLVHSGNTAIRHTQAILKLKQDAKVGPITIAKINQAHENLLHASMKVDRIKFLKGIVARNSSQKKFLNGWLNRVDLFK